MNPEIIKQLKETKSKYAQEGFYIRGIFGSRSRGENHKDSDIDILYKLEEPVFSRYPGLRFFGLYKQIKEELEQNLGYSVDLADESVMSKISREKIERELIHV